ncbi:hypothetical protein V8C86DRAFT_2557043 [Haematococcus lacustris]
MFLKYKELKKQLKSMSIQLQPLPGSLAKDADAVSSGLGPVEGAVVQSAASGVLSSDEAKFIATLNEDLTRFNQFFIDREEESVIQMQRLAEQLAAATTQEQVAPLKSALVEFHGNCILLLHWSLLNYAAVAKILKKHDKRTGVLLRAPCLANVLQQPFNSTSIMSRLVKQAEELLATAMSGGFPGPAQQDSTTAGTSSAACCTATSRGDNRGARGAAQRGEGQEEDEVSSASAMDEVQEEAVMVRRTQAALQTWALLSSTAITPSTILVEQGQLAALQQLPKQLCITPASAATGSTLPATALTRSAAGSAAAASGPGTCSGDPPSSGDPPAAPPSASWPVLILSQPLGTAQHASASQLPRLALLPLPAGPPEAQTRQRVPRREGVGAGGMDTEQPGAVAVAGTGSGVAAPVTGVVQPVVGDSEVKLSSEPGFKRASLKRPAPEEAS